MRYENVKCTDANVYFQSFKNGYFHWKAKCREGRCYHSKLCLSHHRVHHLGDYLEKHFLERFTQQAFFLVTFLKDALWLMELFLMTGCKEEMCKRVMAMMTHVQRRSPRF